MKNIIAYIFTILSGLSLSTYTVLAQPGSEIKFNPIGNPSASDRSVVTASTVVNSKQSTWKNGIHFSITVKNNSSNTISIKNIAEILNVALYNDRGLNIAIENESIAPVNRRDRKWKFRSEAVIPDRAYKNGNEEKVNLKQLEYIEIPSSGKYTVNLILRNVKVVETPRDVRDKFLKPTTKLAPGKYKLVMWLSIIPKNTSPSFPILALESPMINIDYSR